MSKATKNVATKKINVKEVKVVWFISEENLAPSCGSTLFLSYDDCQRTYDGWAYWSEGYSPRRLSEFPASALVGVIGRIWFDGSGFFAAKEDCGNRDNAQLIEVEIVK